MADASGLPAGVELRRDKVPGAERVLTHDALAFVADLQRRFGPLRIELLQRREERQGELDAGIRPDFGVSTRELDTLVDVLVAFVRSPLFTERRTP